MDEHYLGGKACLETLKKKQGDDKHTYFSAAKAALDMQMSVSQSVRKSVTLIFLSDLLVYFIIANRTEMKLIKSLNNPGQQYNN